MKQVQELYIRGGHFQLAAQKVKEMIGEITFESKNPLKNFKITNHGETRIKHCIKYDLSGYCRLITIQENDITTLVFVGTHDECDKWLNANKGIQLAIDKETLELKSVFKSIDISNPEKRVKDDTDLSKLKLVDKLKDNYLDIIADLITGSKYRSFSDMNSLTSEDEIFVACQNIDNVNVQELFFDVFMSLKAGKIDEAKNRIHQYRDELILTEKAGKAMIDKAVSNDQYLVLDDFRKQDIENILNRSNWYEWMLFMHPAQRTVVERNFKGPARLLGVSGSGKTSVIVNRAVRLAAMYPNEKILILTLNRALSKLITDLISYATQTEIVCTHANNLEVKSFWKLCQELLVEFDPANEKLYYDFTHKNLEDVEEIWDEYYQCEGNNDDAKVMEPVHRSLLSRGLYPHSYIKQEFDWIRSAIPNGNREKYLEIEREGRTINFTPDFRRYILDGLKAWEEKMRFVGVSDYLGLVKPLYDYIDLIEPRYRCILVDELQDFGTSELLLIRKLVKENENDLFLTGDIAQQVNTKHHKITQAGITIIPENYVKILKNYRNSREILEAAFSVFSNNTNKGTYENGDFELLNPEFANFSSPKPFIRKSVDLKREFSYSLSYLNSILDENSKGCIAIAGYGYYDVNNIGSTFNLPVLNGKADLSEGKIFISDLEQTKGFEFDRMIIINANNGVIPNTDLPEDEWYQEISKIYVAMTRAKKELIISYSGDLSPIFNRSLEYFNTTYWNDYITDLPINEIFDLPKPRHTLKFENYIQMMTGEQFLYTRKAIGLSPESQLKIRSLVTGKLSSLDRKQKEWIKMGDLISLIRGKRQKPYLSRLLGPNVYQELMDRFEIQSVK